MKRTRQDKIIELISAEEIETQEDLAKRLQEAGFKVTQATVSRDIRELALTKVAGQNGRPKYCCHRLRSYITAKYSERYTKVLQSGMVSMAQADNLLVIKTVSGMAMAVATAVDALEIDEIVGCIAGDDTIMCAVRSAGRGAGSDRTVKKFKVNFRRMKEMSGHSKFANIKHKKEKNDAAKRQSISPSSAVRSQ